MLILAGVSINLVIGNNGIITRAEDAKRKTELAMQNEQQDLLSLVDEIDEKLGKLPSTTETKPYLPTGFSKVEGTNLDTGLIIQDSVGNQYVWVEVPMNEAVYPTAGLGITTFDDTAYTNIENDLHTYTRTYRNGTSYTDTYYPDTNNTSNWFVDEQAYNTAKHNMLKSVYENGGFYVGRYETGIETTQRPRTAKGDTTQIPIEMPVIKANAYPYNWITRTQAKVLAESMEHGDRTSSLMFGVQWDLVLKYLETKNSATQDELKTDSKKIGNYANAKFPITSTKAKYAIYSKSSYTLGNWNDVPTDYKKPDSGTENYVLLTTGSNETRNSKMNICDIAGNVYEWTLEYTSSTDEPCASRGGFYHNDGSHAPASSHYGLSTTYSLSNIGFRVSLY